MYSFVRLFTDIESKILENPFRDNFLSLVTLSNNVSCHTLFANMCNICTLFLESHL